MVISKSRLTMWDASRECVHRASMIRRCKVCKRGFVPKNNRHVFCRRQCKDRWNWAEKSSRFDKDPRPKLLMHARERARRKGVPFRLTVNDIPPIPEDGKCPVLGIPLMRALGFQGDGSPTLDRIIPHLGYVPGNVRIISFRANTLKGDGTAEEHEAIAKYIRENTPV